ncbi:Crp/Fnr family transcriptional regulator [Ruminiclostridium josui]|nr:Crp/Fnr family transcriptional regulator [Ruminiclostridium josui]
MAGSRYHGMGILLEGNGVVTKENAAGNRVMMNLIKPGSIFGEVIAFSGTEKWPSNVQAQTNCRVMFIENEMILNQCSEACSHHSQLIRNLLKSVSTRAIMLNRRVEYLSMKGINSKIASFLLEYMEKAGSNTFRLPVNRNEMAEFLNISRPSMSREMGIMRDKGIIEFHKEAIKIIDVEKLIRMIEE